MFARTLYFFWIFPHQSLNAGDTPRCHHPRWALRHVPHALDGEGHVGEHFPLLVGQLGIGEIHIGGLHVAHEVALLLLPMTSEITIAG